ncbi:MAG: GNAT family N-acetyltransferase, partial [Flavisolibacter sp.]
FGADKPGTVYYDPTTDALFELFTCTPHSVYYVAEFNGMIVGGAGIFPSPGLPNDTCELVKMYLLSEFRGIGLGKKMINQAISFAKAEGFKNIYIETMNELKNALAAYQKLGFEYIPCSLGNTGHFGCDLFMIMKI